MARCPVFFQTAMEGIPAGGIILWSGAANAIPTGWALCNGSNGTPDLRGRFVLGASESYAVGDTGGEETHTLSVAEMPRHVHGVSIYTPSSSASTTGSLTDIKFVGRTASSQNTSYAGSTSSHNNMPPYYALCYIMKL